MDSLGIINALGICTIVLIVTINVRRIYLTTKNKWSLPVLTLLVIATFLFVCIPMIVSLPIFWMYRELIRVYLKLKHRSRFGGLIEGADIAYLIGSHEKNVISILFVIECVDTKKPEGVYEDFKNVIHKSFLTNPDNFLPLHCGVRSCGGYSYKLKEDVTVDDCVRKMKQVKCSNNILSEEALKNLVNNCTKEPFLKTNSLFWDTFVGSQPIDWSHEHKENMNYYPILFRIHHAIGDGFAIAQLLSIMIDKTVKYNEDSLKSYLKSVKEESRFTQILYNIAISLFSLSFMASEFLINFIARKPPNILRGPKLTGNDIFAMKVDNGDYLKKIKTIKQKIPSTGFADIVMTAFSGSFNDHFNNHSTHCPEEISIVVPFSKKTTSLPQLPIGQLAAHNVSFTNSFIMLTLDFPICIENNKNSNLMQRLKVVKQQSRESYQSITNKVMYFWAHIANQTIPIPLLEKSFGALQWTTVLSILPGPDKSTMADGNLPIQSLIFWLPHLAGMGINITVVSYDSKLQLGLKVDKGIIGNEEDAHRILDNVFRYIDLFEAEIE